MSFDKTEYQMTISIAAFCSRQY